MLTLLELLVQLAIVVVGSYLMAAKSFLIGAGLIAVMIVIQGIFSKLMDAMSLAYVKALPPEELRQISHDEDLGIHREKPAAWMRIENTWKAVLIALFLSL